MSTERRSTTGISLPESRRGEFEAALLKLKLRRPFDSNSKIISDAVIQVAAQLDQNGHETSRGDGIKNRAPDVPLLA